MSNKKFIVAASYKWDNSDSKNVINKIIKTIKKNFDGHNHVEGLPYKIEFRKLRASAGRFLFERIFERIKEANILLVDISGNNPNVMMELGIALALQKETRFPEIYLLQKGKIKTPSNINGYFVNMYTVEEEPIISDSHSLNASIKNFIISYYSKIELGEPINELEDLK